MIVEQKLCAVKKMKKYIKELQGGVKLLPQEILILRLGKAFRLGTLSKAVQQN